MNIQLNNIVIMKYGVHVREDVNNIISRKILEYQNCGRMFWGYNGVLCNPTTQIQPFLAKNRLCGEDTFLLLVRTYSDYNGVSYEGKEFSHDKSQWTKIPKDIKVVGSKYAIICEELMECDFQLNLNNYVVAIGNSANKSLCNYLRGRVDKACACFKEKNDSELEKKVQVSFFSKILDAVYIR